MATKYVNQSILGYYDGKIKEYIAAQNVISTLATYADLPTQNVRDGQRYFVLNATGDQTVASGWAIYIAHVTTSGSTPSVEWRKIAEGESLDVVVGWDSITGKPSIAASDHVHGNITNDGKLGSTANVPLITGANGVIQAGSFGNAANTFCQGNDSRLSDSRDPNDHASNKVTAMTGYSKASAAASIGTSDTLNVAIGKLEYKLDEIQDMTTADVDALFAA